MRVSEGTVEFGNELVDLCFEFRELPGFVLLLQILACADATQQLTQVDSLLSRRQSAFAGFDLHIVEVNKFLGLHEERVGNIGLNGLSFGIDIRDHNDIFVGSFPKGLFFIFDLLVAFDLDIGIAPALLRHLNF